MTRLEEIEQRLGEATAGPWGAYERQGPVSCVLKRKHWRIGSNDGKTAEERRGVAIVFGDSDSDAALITNAPSDIRYLLDTIRTLSADIERMERVTESLDDKLTDALRENVRMRAAIMAAYDDTPGWCDLARAILEGSKPE